MPVSLARIGFHGAQVRAGDHHQINILANHAGKHLQVFSDDRVQVYHFRSQQLFTTKSQKLAGKRCGPLRGISNFLSGTAESRIGTNAIQQKLTVS